MTHDRKFCVLCVSGDEHHARVLAREELERHCREDHASGQPPDQEPYLSDTFEPGYMVTWDQVHHNLHKLAGKHGEPAHRTAHETGWGPWE